MGFFDRKKASPAATAAAEMRISFEGETPAITAQFKSTYEGAVHGLEVLAASKSNRRELVGLLFVVAFSAMALPTLFSYTIWSGIVALLVIGYLIFTQLAGPGIARKDLAKKMAESAKESTLNIFPAGCQIIEEDQVHNIAFRVVEIYESPSSYVFVIGGSQMIVFDKTIFGDNNPLVREIFVVNTGSRYSRVDEKGKAIK